MIEKLKDILKRDKKTSNLVLIVILLVVLLISTNYIFNTPETAKNITEVSNNNVIVENLNDLEIKLSKIISKIKGVEDAHVMISYSTTEKVIPVYDVKENTDSVKENSKESVKSITEKTVAYESKDGNKMAIVESRETAQAVGAVVVVNGNITCDIEGNIKQAVANTTSIPIHKIQIFVNQ